MIGKEQNDYERTKQVILSCQSLDQLKVAVKMYNQLNIAMLVFVLCSYFLI